MRLRTLLCCGTLLALGTGTASAAPRGAGGAVATPRPNVVVIMTDDQTVESLRVMPNVKALLADEGTTFDGAYVSFSLCCPSRATFLTGQYAHNHGVLSNRPPDGGYYKLDSSNTLPVWLQRAGYQTVMVGKYLNSYGFFDPVEIPPGWNEWRATIDPSGYNYFGYTINEGGRLLSPGSEAVNYQTDFLTSRATEIIGRRAPDPAPYFLWVAYLAPHANAPEGAPPVSDGRPFGLPISAPRHQGRFASEPLPAPPSFNELDVSDKPAGIRELPGISEKLAGQIRENYQRRLESLLAVDEGVAAIVEAARASGELANTVFLFTSDNGYLLGEHRVPNGKVLPYEPSIRVPLILRGPAVPRGLHLGQPTWNGDLTATILDLAGASPGKAQDGRSLLPLLKDPAADWGRDILLESSSEAGNLARFAGIHTPWYAYAEYANGDRELYDLRKDPYELDSLHADPAHAAIRDELSRRLALLRSCAGETCRRGADLRLSIGYLKRASGCARSPVTVRVGGPDAARLLRVTYAVDGRGQSLVTSAPWASRLSPTVFARGKPSLMRARAVLSDGRTTTLDRSVVRCPR